MLAIHSTLDDKKCIAGGECASMYGDAVPVHTCLCVVYTWVDTYTYGSVYVSVLLRGVYMGVVYLYAVYVPGPSFDELHVASEENWRSSLSLW